MRLTGRASLVLSIFVGLVFWTPSAFAQQARLNYVYDEVGRLVAVIDQQGDVAVYNYDAVGNLLSIERVDASPEAVAISLVTPSKGKVGTTATIFGKGFSATPSQNTVAFNGTAATVTEAAPNRLVTSVPSGATTGPITLTTPLGNASWTGPFTVIGGMATLVVTPGSALIVPSRTQQFQAMLDGSPTTSVTWAVNGIPGGESAVGTISTSGLYMAPATTALSTTVTVTATHVEDPTLTASAAAVVVVPRPLMTAASVAVTQPPATVEKNLTVTGSVVVEPGATVNNNLAAAGSVLIGPAAATVNNNLVAAASVQNAPVVSGASPSNTAPGTNALTVTVTGVGFTDATAVAFRLGNAADWNIATSDLIVTSDTELSVTVDIALGAAVGLRVIQVTTPSGASTITGTGSNLFTVQ